MPFQGCTLVGRIRNSGYTCSALGSADVPKQRLADKANEMRVGLLWRAEWDPQRPDVPVDETCKLRGVFAAFASLGIDAEPVIYSDASGAAVRDQLLDLDGALVWANPIEQGLDRSKLDTLLRDVAGEGVWVSAHPDVILKMATKKVLVDTSEMSWGTDTRLYLSSEELREQLPARAADGRAKVLKQERGMGGHGVWKVELDGVGDDPWLHVQQATRGAASERLRLSTFAARCEQYFAGGSSMVEQPFQQRISEGMIRVYLTHDQVVGFAHQYPAGLRPASAGKPPPGKVFELPTAPAYSELRRARRVEMVAGNASAARPRHTRATRDLGRRLSLRRQDRVGRRHLRPMRDQRQLHLRIPRARDADRRPSRP
jgi:hypothetical protein